MGEYIEVIESVLSDGWEVYDPEMGMDCLLLAPCGNVVERDGTCPCPERHVSPLIEAGLA